MIEKKLEVTVSSTSARQQREYDSGWKERNYDTPPDEHPIFHYVGLVTAEWARLEHSLDNIVWLLAEMISSRGACITGQLMGATPRYRAILALLKLRSAAHPELKRYTPRVTKLMQNTYEPQDQRNRIVHDPWLVDTIHDEPAQFRTWPAKNLQFGIRDVDLKDIKGTIESVKALTAKIEALFLEINADMRAIIEQKRKKRASDA